MSKAKEIKLEIPCNAASVSIARKALEGFAIQLGLADEVIDDLKLAVGEICTNAVKFGCPGADNICIRYRVKSDHLEIEVRNQGDFFPQEKQTPTKPQIENLPVGGLGLYLADQVMDELAITSEGGHTTVRMSKRLR